MDIDNIFTGIGFLLGGFALVVWVVAVIVCIAIIICQMKMISAAGRPGWSAFIPLYNLYVICQIAFGQNLGWLAFVAVALPFIPLLGSIASVALSCYIAFYFAKAYGKSDTEAVLYVLFAPVMLIYWIATNNYKYIGPQSNYFTERFR